MVYASIELINGEDLIMVRRSKIDRDEVRRTTVNMLVDSGAYMMCINENIRDQLRLEAIERRRVELADGAVQHLDIVGPLEIRFADRRCTGSAIVLPGDAEPLLGAIPMEEMDLLIHPKRQELIANPHDHDADPRLRRF